MTILEQLPGATTWRVIPEIGHSYSDNKGSKTIIRTAKGLYSYRLTPCRVVVVIGDRTGQGNLTCDLPPIIRTVLIGVDPPVVNLFSDHNQIDEGGSTTFRWTSTGAITCTSSQLSGVSAPSGSSVYTAPIFLIRDITQTVNIKCGGEGGEVTAAKTITIKAVNDAPLVSSIGNVVVNEDVSTGLISFTISDEETPVQSLLVTATSDNTSLLPNSGILLGGTAGNRTIKLTPAANKFGEARVTVRVSDGALSVSRIFTLKVNPVNDPPSISAISGLSIPQAQAATAPISFTISDLETSPSRLIVTATSSNKSLVPDSNLILNGTEGNRALVIKPIGTLKGTSTITITVKDPEGATTSRLFNFIRSASPPELNITSVNSSEGKFLLNWRFGTDPVRIVEILPSTGERRFIPELNGYHADQSGSISLTRNNLNGTYKYELYSCKIVVSTGDGTGQGNLVCDQLVATKNVFISISAPSVTFGVNKNTIGENESVQISWNASNAVSCKKTGFSTADGVLGSAIYKAPDIIVVNESKTFSIECEGPGGVTKKSVSITLKSSPFEWAQFVSHQESDSAFCKN